MNKFLINKCEKLIKTSNNGTLLYDDIVKSINANKNLAKCSCTIPNALDYIKNAGITIVMNNQLLSNEKATIEKVEENKEKEDDIDLEILDEPDDDALDNLEDDESEDEDKPSRDLGYYCEDSVDLYLRSISSVQTRLLTVEEERELCTAAQSGDLEARNKMVNHNLKLVVSIAKRYIGVNSFMEYIDLIQCGNLGLMKAIDRFDPDRGFKFSTYATWWIRQSITRAIADEGRNIRIPVHAVEQLRFIRRATHALIAENANTYTPSFEEIANYCNKHGLVVKTSGKRVLSAEDVQRYVNLSNNSDTISLFTKIGEDEHGQETYLGDFISNEQESVEDEAVRNDLRRRFEYIFDNCLTEREAMVLRLRFGFDDDSPKTLEQVGQIFGVTRERIRQIESKAMRKMKTRASISKLLK